MLDTDLAKVAEVVAANDYSNATRAEVEKDICNALEASGHESSDLLPTVYKEWFERTPIEYLPPDFMGALG